MITFLVSCNNNRNHIIIENFHSLDSIYYQQNILSKKSYLVNGYDNTYIEDIDKHFCSLNIDSLYGRYQSSFSIIYFRKSNFTNNEELRNGDRVLYDYSYDNDHIVVYEIVSRSLIAKRFYGLREKSQNYEIFKC